MWCELSHPILPSVHPRLVRHCRSPLMSAAGLSRDATKKSVVAGPGTGSGCLAVSVAGISVDNWLHHWLRLLLLLTVMNKENRC